MYGIYAAAVLTAILLFPVAADCYVFADTRRKRLNINFVLYKFIKLVNINIDYSDSVKMYINGRKKPLIGGGINFGNFKLLKFIYVTKAVQLCDFGIAGDGGAYAAVAHRAATAMLYRMAAERFAGCKLKNYTVLNVDEPGAVCCAALSAVTAPLLILAVALIIFAEKFR